MLELAANPLLLQATNPLLPLLATNIMSACQTVPSLWLLLCSMHKVALATLPGLPMPGHRMLLLPLLLPYLPQPLLNSGLLSLHAKCRHAL